MNPQTPQYQPLPRRQPMSRAHFFIILVIVAVVSFVIGTRSTELEALLGWQKSGSSLNLGQAEAAYRLLKDKFDGELNGTKLSDGAAAGLVAAAGDPHTSYLTAEEATEFNSQLRGEVSGIGAEIGVRGDQPTILRLLADSPAETSGLKVGDVFMSVDGKLTNKADAATTADLIRGKAGTDVKLTVKRGTATHSFTITRATVTDPSVASEIKDGIGIMKIRRFDSDTGTLARRAAETMKDANVKGIILDLRDNPGGYLEQSREVAGLWLDHKLVVTERRGGKETDSLDSTGLPVLSGVKTIVLVNGSSASASEIVAGALKDHKAATLIGETTYGKGTVQQVFSMADGAELKVTVAHWYTPGGVNIAKKGISPDSEVKLTLDDLNAGRDPQLDVAMKAL